MVRAKAPEVAGGARTRPAGAEAAAGAGSAGELGAGPFKGRAGRAAGSGEWGAAGTTRAQGRPRPRPAPQAAPLPPPRGPAPPPAAAGPRAGRLGRRAGGKAPGHGSGNYQTPESGTRDAASPFARGGAVPGRGRREAAGLFLPLTPPAGLSAPGARVASRLDPPAAPPPRPPRAPAGRELMS